MKTKLLILTAALSFAFAGSVMAMSKEDYKAGMTKVSADYKVNKDKCSALSANAKDICISEAKGMEKVSKAELESQYKPSPKNTEKVALAKGDAAYDTAKEKCDDLKSDTKDVCVKEAKAAHIKANQDAKVVKVSATTQQEQSAKIAEAKKDATSEKREADYKVAAERCDSLTGASKDSCMSTAKNQYGMK
jgi:hypothetical protein